MYRKTRTWCALIVMMLGFNALSDETTKEHNGLLLYILAGQSNMAGVGGRVHPRHMEPMPRASILNRSMLLTQQNKTKPRPMPDPLFRVFGTHWDRLGDRGLGPEWGFITTLLEHDPGARIGIIKIPASGSNIERWINDRTLERGGGDYYNNVVETVLEAKKHGTLKAFLWHQGESNSASRDYDQLFERMIEGYREAFGEPDLPVIAGTIGKDGDKPGNVNNGLKKAAEKMKNVRIVSSVRTMMDHVHYDADSQDEMGRRYANAYLAMTGQPQPLNITTPRLPEGRADCRYAADITANGGDGSHRHWKCDGLPDGLTLENGILQGNLPSEPGALHLTVTVSDHSGADTVKLSLPVAALPQDRIDIIPEECFTVLKSGILRDAREIYASPNWQYGNYYRSYVKFTIPPAFRKRTVKELRLFVIMSGGTLKNTFPANLQISALTDPAWNPDTMDQTKLSVLPESTPVGAAQITGETPRELVIPLTPDIGKLIDEQGQIVFEVRDPGMEQGPITFLYSNRGEKPPRLVVSKDVDGSPTSQQYMITQAQIRNRS